MKKIVDYANFLNEIKVSENIIIQNLKRGFAICVYKEDFTEFFDILESAGWIRFTKIDDEEILKSIGEKLYFVLFGDVVLHTTEPKFGGHDLEVFTPSFK